MMSNAEIAKDHRWTADLLIALGKHEEAQKYIEMAEYFESDPVREKP